jgi:putative phage-type endonuclease
LDQETWLRERKTGIGASDAAAIFGLSPYKSALALYYEKLGLAEVSPAETEALEWGRVLERPIGERYAKETQRRLAWPDGFEIRRHKSLTFMLATLDAAVEPPAVPAKLALDVKGDLMMGPGVLECKNVHLMSRDAWRDEPPIAFQIQVQHQLAVMGWQWGSLAGLVGGSSFLWTDIARNQEFIGILMEREQAFWDGVMTRRPPDVDGSDSTKELLRLLFPRERVIEPVELPLEAADWDVTLQKAKGSIKALESVKAEMENKLKHAIGDSVAGVLRGGEVLYTHKLQKRVGFEVKPTEFRVLRRKGPKDNEPT